MQRRSQSLGAVVTVSLVLVLGWLIMAHAQEGQKGILTEKERALSISESAVANIGLLPIYGVNVTLDPAWVDNKWFPSRSTEHPNFGVSDSFQRLWDDYLKACGFNVLRVPVDLNGGLREAFRLANLSVWAQNNNVKLAPILVGATPGKPLSKDYPAEAADLVHRLLFVLKKNLPSGLEAYKQIMFYQLENELNHPASHGIMNPDAVVALLSKAAARINQAEQSALRGTSLRPTPLMVSFSFDYELVRGGAIAGVDLDEEVYQQAYESLRQFAAALTEVPEIQLISIEWLPGSLSAGASDRLPDLVQRLTASALGKQWLVSTGYSTAFRPEEKQAEFFLLSFTNLADLRAGGGLDSPFAGVLWRQALDRYGREAEALSEEKIAAISKWDWPAKAQELAQMWEGAQAGSEELRWWLKRVESKLGVLSIAAEEAGAPAVVPKQAYEILTNMHNTVAEVSQETGLAEAAEEFAAIETQETTPEEFLEEPGPEGETPSEPSAGGGFEEQLMDTLKGSMGDILNAVVEKAKSKILGGFGGESEYGSDIYAGGEEYPPEETFPEEGGEIEFESVDLSIEGPVASPASANVGEDTIIDVTVANAGPDAAVDVYAALMDGTGSELGYSDTVIVEPGSTQSTQVVWTPIEAKTYTGVKVYALADPSQTETNPANNEAAIGTITVTEPGDNGGDGEPKPPGPTKWETPKVLEGFKGLKSARDAGFLKLSLEQIRQ